MANTLNIPERTLAQLADSTNSINVIGGADGRVSAYQPLVCRATDHNSDDGGTTDNADGMALFVSTRHGEPWKKDAGAKYLILHQGLLPPADVTVLFPDFDYSTFE
jgi:hypothetical protein